MRKTLGKLSSLLLAAILVLSAISPIAVFAGEEYYYDVLADVEDVFIVDDSDLAADGLEISESEYTVYEITEIPYVICEIFAIEDIVADGSEISESEYTVYEITEIPYVIREIFAIEDFAASSAESEYTALTDELAGERLRPDTPTQFRSPALESQIALDASIMTAMQGISADYLLSSDISQFDIGITPFNTNPNFAIHIPESLFGLYLQDLANHEERWYRFDVPANRKITNVLYYDSGVYDLYLFRLNGTNLDLVAHSILGGGFERLSHISQSGGTYFLAVAPFIPAAVPHLFTFAIFVSSNFDAFELNDVRGQAPVSTNTINLNANIDNPYDADWFRLNVTTAGTRSITVSNAPAGNNYALFLYRGMNRILSFFVNGTATRNVDFGVGNYYVRIESMTGVHTTANYNLRVQNFVPPRPIIRTLTIPRQQLSDRGYYRLSPRLPFVPGGQLELTLTVSAGDQLGVHVYLEFEGYPENTVPEPTFVFDSGTTVVTWNFPYRRLHVPGMPLWPPGYARIALIPSSGWNPSQGVEVSGTIRTLGR